MSREEKNQQYTRGLTTDLIASVEIRQASMEIWQVCWRPTGLVETNNRVLQAYRRSMLNLYSPVSIYIHATAEPCCHPRPHSAYLTLARVVLRKKPRKSQHQMLLLRERTTRNPFTDRKTCNTDISGKGCIMCMCMFHILNRLNVLNMFHILRVLPIINMWHKLEANGERLLASRSLSKPYLEALVSILSDVSHQTNPWSPEISTSPPLKNMANVLHQFLEYERNKVHLLNLQPVKFQLELISIRL